MNNKILFILLAIVALGSVIYIIYDGNKPHEHSRQETHDEGDHSHGPHGEH
ncbi:MAG: hypothetical protein LW832_03305 [Parachlamydia sp.]|jgi:hypothetical protein|nr:hypothetical protein [Parachlamydia sp.]